MADWRDAYRTGDEIDAKLRDRWLPGTVDKRVGDFALSCKLAAGDLLIDSPDRIRKRAKAAQPAAKAAEPAAKPVEKPAESAAKPVEKPAEPAAKPAEPPAKPVGKGNEGPPA